MYSLDRELAGLVDDLTEVALGACAWTTPLSRLAALTGSKSAELFAFGAAPFHFITEFDREEIVAFSEMNGHDPRINSRVRVGMCAPAGAILDENDFSTERDGRCHPLYGKAIEQLDIPYAQLCILDRSSEGHTGLTVLGTRRGGPPSGEQTRILAAAANHFRNAWRAHRATEHRGMTLTAHGFEQTGVAAFVLDRAGQVQAWSAHADAMLRRGDLRMQNRRLQLRDVSNPSLSIAVERARTSRRIDDAPTNSVVARTEDGLAYILEVIPLPARHGFEFEAGAVVIARAPREVERNAARAAHLLYGLTPAESAVAGLLAAGLSAQTIAERQGVAIGTVRTHIRRVLEKTGSRSQLDLVTSILARI